MRLANFFRADNIKQWVTPAVIWANQESSLTVQNPTTAVWTLERLADELGNLWGGTPVPQDNLKKIVDSHFKMVVLDDRPQRTLIRLERV